MIDIKGDLPNLLLTFPKLSAEESAPWADAGSLQRSGGTIEQAAEALASSWRKKLADWRLGPPEVASLRAAIAPRVFTPGPLAREPLHVRSSLERPSPL